MDDTASKVPTRRLGRSGIEVSAVGLGCWAIGGPAWRGTNPIGWGEVDDAESVRAIRRGIELGVTLFDTADVYGAGHSERILGQAIASCRDDVVIATKFGVGFDETTKQAGISENTSPVDIRRACEASLARLGTDRIDLYQFHLGAHDPGQAAEVRDVLEDLVIEGKIRSYGWSTDDPERLAVFAKGPSCAAMQIAFNVLAGDAAALALCEAEGLGALIRGPLLMGILTGKFDAGTKLPADDVRTTWDFASGPAADQRRAVDALRDVLGAGDRTLAQGALAWLLARSPVTLPIPGFKSVAQVEDNAGALTARPLTPTEMAEIETILGREVREATP